MAHAVESQVSNLGTKIRENLTRAERLVVNPSPAQVETLLTLLDQIEQQFDEVDAGGLELGAEQVRWESLLRRLERRPAKIVSAASRAGGYRKLRAQHPPAESFWWHLDTMLSRRRRNGFLRTFGLLAGVLGGIALVFWLINTLFPPDPAAVYMVNVNARLDEAIMAGDWADALVTIEDAQRELPDEAELYVWEAVIAERANDADRAAEAAARAQALMADDLPRYWVVTADHYLRTGALEEAEAAANSALALDDENAPAMLILGQIAEVSGDYPLAIERYDLAYQMAEESDGQLAAIARVRMASAMQSFQAAGPPRPTPTP